MICKLTNNSRIGTVGMQPQVNNACRQKEIIYKLKYNYVTINGLC